MYTALFEECDRLEAVAKDYQNQCGTIYGELLKDVVRTEYARGGQTIHRGYYCPSPVYDILVGGASRGRLLKDRKRVRKKPDYEYGFNARNELVVVQSDFYREIILREQDTERGLLFDQYSIQAVTECQYADETIQSYIYALFLESQVIDYRKEQYTYGTEGLQFVDCYDFMPIRMHMPRKIREWVLDKTDEELPALYSHERMEFTHKDGYLYQYKAVPVDDPLNRIIRSYPEIRSDHEFIYEVNVRRKI